MRKLLDRSGGQAPDPPPVEAHTPVGRWVGRHALLLDVVVATAVFLYDAMYVTSLYVGFGTVALPVFIALLALSASICVLYVLRHAAVVATAIAIFVAACGYIVLGAGIAPGPLIVLGASLYFLSTRVDGTWVVPAVALVVAWVIVAAGPVLRSGYLRIGEVGVLVLAVVFSATVGLFTQARRRHVARLRELNRQLARERDARARVAAAEERARIARETHDIVSHSLGTMVVMADGAAHTAETDPRQAALAMARVRDTGRDALTQMRRMLGVLRDDAVTRAPQPGLDQLDRLVDDARSTGLRVDATVEGAPRTIPPDLDLAAYRIVQEALTNARKHGGPILSLVTVRVRYGDDQVELRVTDDGHEPDATGDDEGGAGHGLIGMRERAAAYGGSLTAGPRADGGFEVTAVLPIGDTT
ncbi:MAG TPA: hypothetical protein H9902_01270 [Candidatus Stackebrandtia faecavium]|nr:hypothetical protein [Candidatus Stackebrandtia faecavium]